MYCEEKNNLISEYGRSLSKLSQAVSELNRAVTSPNDQYEQLKRFADEAELESEQVRFALEHHIANHCC